MSSLLAVIVPKSLDIGPLAVTTLWLPQAPTSTDGGANIRDSCQCIPLPPTTIGKLLKFFEV